ncbi:MAG: acyl carrier protein [Lachnospiraceae bacterium]|nr:acyl carrier protein [Lachnospiraceae bacterium]
MKEIIMEALAEVLERDVSEIDEEQELAEFFEWDSLAVMGFVSLIDKKLSKHVSAVDIWHCEYVYEIIDLLEEA